jgi:hypothetical protein
MEKHNQSSHNSGAQVGNGKPFGASLLQKIGISQRFDDRMGRGDQEKTRKE